MQTLDGLDDDRMITIELYPDEIMSLITVACNKWGWTPTERIINDTPRPLIPAVEALYDAIDRAMED